MAGIHERLHVGRKEQYGRRKANRQETVVEKPAETFPYREHTEKVKQQLAGWGFGETVSFLTEHGLDRPTYLSFAREKLLGPEYKEGIPPEKGLPEKVGETNLPPLLREHGQDIEAAVCSLNVGYGHLRPGLALTNVVDLLGGSATNVFLGGDEDVLPRTGRIGTAGRLIDLNRLLRAVTRLYRHQSLESAYRQGMMSEKPQDDDPDPFYTTFTRHLVGIAGSKNLKEYLTDPDKAIANIFGIQDIHSPKEVQRQQKVLRFLAVKSLTQLLRNLQGSSGKKDVLAIGTQATVAQTIGLIPQHVKDEIGLVDGHFQPDVGMIFASYTQNPPTYTEKAETAEKWGYRMGLSGQHAPNTEVLDGYVTPLSVFVRNELTAKRQEALRSGHPITVMATASGIAPTQLGSFIEFMTSHQDLLRNDKLRMVIQCGAQEGGGLAVHKELSEKIQQLGLENHVVLHVAQDPKAAVEFFEVATWAPVPLAILVKGSEVSRMSYALDIPLIPTGAVGDHELWNIAANVLDNPNRVVFTPKTATVLHDEFERVLTNDSLVVKNPNRQYTQRLSHSVAKQTAQTPQDTLTMLSEAILHSDAPLSRQDAMLHFFELLLKRKYGKEENKYSRP